MSSKLQDTVAPESRNSEEAADEDDNVTEDAVTSSIPETWHISVVEPMLISIFNMFAIDPNVPDLNED